MDSPKAASVRLLSPPAAAPPPAAAAVWEWNARPDGDDGDPRSWKRYPPADAALLERQYRKDGGSVSKCQLNAEYDVCFSDKRHGMVQIRRDDASRWRRVRRLGGELVPRPRAKPIRCVADVDGSSSGSSRFGSDDDYDREDSFINDDDDDDESSDDSESSFSFDSESSSSSEGSKRKRKRRKMEKTRQKPTQRK
jgi:hypothetical protein